MDDKVRESLLHANSPEEVIDNADDEATKEEEKEARTRGSGRWCDKWFCKYDRC